MRRNHLLISSLILFVMAAILLWGIFGCASNRTPNDCLLDAKNYRAELAPGQWSKIMGIDYTDSGYPGRHYILAFELNGKIALQDSDGATITGFKIGDTDATPMNLAFVFTWIRRWPDSIKITRSFFIEEGD